ncbi:MAG: hypothetical protein LBV13_06450 [Methanomassiliicoccaceae archaeon]|jgi:hypothetical protein|nr:hypothetical protein [Methanomassiliicoccaceae archaeon]
MKVSSIHFILSGKTPYKDLAPAFPDILKMFLMETDQMPEDEEILMMFIELNMSDLLRNMKPEGYNRKGRMRMVFPTDKSEFYIKAVGKGVDVARVGERISEMLSATGVRYKTVNNDIPEL